MSDARVINRVKRYTSVDVDKILAKYIDNYWQYKDQFDRAANNMDCQSTPMYIVVELNNYCNMRCKMCPHSMDESTNGNDNMSIEMFRKIVHDANDIKCPSFILGGRTECTINPHIMDFISICQNEGNQIDNVLITNGYKLTEELASHLIDAKWSKLFVSLDAATAETYKKIRGRDLEVVEENLNRVIDMKKARGSELPIIRVSFCVMDENEKEQEEFLNKWKDKVEIVDYQGLVHFEDMTVRDDLPETDNKCPSPFNRLMIDCKGEIFPCCNEWSKNLPLGNINEMTIKDAWNCKLINNLREEMKSGHLRNVCKSCLSNTNFD